MRGHVIGKLSWAVTSFGVDEGAGRVQVEDDLVHEGADVAAAGAAHPQPPVELKRAPERGAARFARVPHL